MAEQHDQFEDTPGIPRWLEEIRLGGDGEGFIEKNLRHSLLFVRRPVNRLLVTFDNLSNVGDRSVEREPWAFKYAREINVSHLGVTAQVHDWYRDKDLVERMQELAAKGFFEGYDRVTFAGVSMGGFASIAFGSLAPGAHIISVNPQSTLNEELVPWETRYEGGRRQDWTLPLSDAAALTRDLGPVNIFYDPYFELDKMHVARFSGENIRVFNCRYSKHKTAVFLRKIDALKPVMQEAIFGELTYDKFYRLYRGRKNLPWYRGAIAHHFEKAGRPETAERFTRLYRKRMAEKKAEDKAAAELAEATAKEAPKESKPKPPAAKTQEKPAETDSVNVKDAKGVGARATASTAAGTKPEAGEETRFTWIQRPVGERSNQTRTIITTMKNEGPFILEWIAYHRAIGFTGFMIYTNDCEDGTDAIGDRLQELGIVDHVDNKIGERDSPQRVALRKALKHSALCRETDWLICSDCDEFVNVRVGDGTLDALFEATGEADAISLCWKLFGNGGHDKYTDKFVTEQFTWGAPEIYWEKIRARGLKTMFRPSEAIRKLGVHRPKFFERPEGFVWKDGGGQLMPDLYYETGWAAHKEFSHDYVRLYHYAVRTVDSFLVKKDRGRTNHIDSVQGIDYWADMNLNMEEDRSMTQTVERTREEFERLMADPEIARMHNEACAWHRKKINMLKAQDEWAKFHEILQQLNRPGEPPADSETVKQVSMAE